MGYLQDAARQAELATTWALDEAGKAGMGAYTFAKSQRVPHPDGIHETIRTEVTASITSPSIIPIMTEALRKLPEAFEIGAGAYDRDPRNPGRPYAYVLRGRF